MMYEKDIFLLLVYFVPLMLSSCNTTEPSGEKPTLSLKLEDVSCTEAWIKLETTNLQFPTFIAIEQNDVTRDTINLTTSDTLIFINSLIPNTSYTFQVSSSEQEISSNKVITTTLDTTSHNFTFETFTFGGNAGSCVLYDVAIINENNIWAVGEINIADTSINGYTMYNSVHWDGNEWELHRIMFYTFCGQQHQNAYPASSIIAFSENDIWVGMQGSQIARLNDTIQTGTFCIPISVRKLWGIVNQNLYAVGVNGQIAYYNGSSWQRIESSTTTNIQDIWGADNLILCAVSNVASAGDRKILKIENNQVSDFFWNTGRRVQSIWYSSSNAIYACGGGVFCLKDGINWNEATEIPLYYTESIRGDELNNIMVVGDFGLMAHFNGASWKVYDNPTADIYYSCAVKENLVVAVGMKGNSGFIVVAKK